MITGLLFPQWKYTISTLQYNYASYDITHFQLHPSDYITLCSSGELNPENKAKLLLGIFYVLLVVIDLMMFDISYFVTPQNAKTTKKNPKNIKIT